MRALGVAWLVSAVAWLLWVLQATVRGWWVQDRRDELDTAEALERIQQSGSTDHYWDGA